MALLTVSFVLYNTPVDEVAQAIAQVRASVSGARIVLVDNSPEPNPVPAVDEGLVTLIRPGANLGYGAGHNRAFACSTEDSYHAVLNTDLTYGPDVFPALLTFMEANPDVGLAMPRVVYPDGKVQHLCRLLPHPLDIFGRGFFGTTRWTAARNDRYEFRHWGYDSVADFPFLSGCFMVLRRSAIDRVGSFDERFFMYGEDVDLSRRLARVCRTSFVPTAPVAHEYRSQGGGIRRMMMKIANLSRYFNKWGWWFDAERDAMNARTIAAIDAAGERDGLMSPPQSAIERSTSRSVFGRP